MTLFYSQPIALRADKHADTKLVPRAGFRFAGTTNAIPLAADEFVEAQAHYPIVFTKGASPNALAVVGLRDHENLFIAEDGAWREGTYLPAYVRRYPFGLAKVPGSDRHVLAVDDTPDAMSTTVGEPLFEDAQPSATTRRALEFCAVYEQQQQRATAFAEALVAADLLVERKAEWRATASERANRFTGFQIIDEARFNALSPETIVAWHTRGWLLLAHAHLMSLRRFAQVATMAFGRVAHEPVHDSGLSS